MKNTNRIALFVLAALVAAGLACGSGASYSASPTTDYAKTIASGIAVASCDRDGDYITVSGSLRNNTSVVIEFVELKVMLKKGGSVVDTDSVYAVGNEGLAPGEMTQWKWMFGPDPPLTDECAARLLDYDIR